MSEPIDLAEIRRTPDPDIIEGLEEVLELAKAGLIRGVACSYVVSGEEVRTWVNSGDAHFADLFLSVAQLKRSMLGVAD